jgi:hypothetical protein
MSQVDIKKLLCEGFCSGISVSQAGKLLNVSVPFEIGTGDPVNFYVVPLDNNLFRIEDDGSLIPFLLATGINIEEGTRAEEFNKILSASGVKYSKDTGELKSKTGSSLEIADIVFQFINAILKIDAIKAPLRPENVSSMFKQDVQNKISQAFGEKASISYDDVLNENLSDFLPDIIVRPHVGKPAAIYLLTNNQRAWEAIALRCKTINEKKMDCSVIALFEKVGTKLVNNRSIASVNNNLDATPYFYDNQNDAISRIGTEIGLSSDSLH